MAQGFEAGHVSAAQLLCPGVRNVTLVLHGLGPGSRWAERCALGDLIEFSCSVAPPIALDRSAGPHPVRKRGFSAGAVRALPCWKRRQA